MGQARFWWGGIRDLSYQSELLFCGSGSPTPFPHKISTPSTLPFTPFCRDKSTFANSPPHGHPVGWGHLEAGKMKLNISYPANGSQKLIDVEDERKLRVFMDKRVSDPDDGHIWTLFSASKTVAQLHGWTRRTQ